MRKRNIQDIGSSTFAQKTTRAARDSVVKAFRINVMSRENTRSKCLMVIRHKGSDLPGRQLFIFVGHCRGNNQVYAVGLTINMRVDPSQLDFKLLGTVTRRT